MNNVCLRFGTRKWLKVPGACIHTDSFTLLVSKYTMQVFILEISGKQEKSLLSGDSCSIGGDNVCIN